MIGSEVRSLPSKSAELEELAEEIANALLSISKFHQFVVQELVSGKHLPEIAQELSVSIRYVRRLTRELHREVPKQMDQRLRRQAEKSRSNPS